jgi:hypothetical protein
MKAHMRVMRWIAWTIAAGCVTCSADIIDRIAVSVGNQVITEDQIAEEIRITAFLNREKADLSSDSKKAEAELLVQQTLMKREMDLSHFRLPDVSEAGESLAGIREQYPGESEFHQALRDYGIDEEILQHRLWWQLAVLRFIDERFRPGIQIPDDDIDAYYAQQAAKWEQEGVKPIPSLEESRDKIEQILTQQRVDNSLDRWVGDARTQVEIRYHAGVFE